MFQTEVVEKTKNAYFMLQSFFPRHLWHHVEKYGTTNQTTNDNVLRRRIGAIFMPDNWGKNTASKGKGKGKGKVLPKTGHEGP